MSDNISQPITSSNQDNPASSSSNRPIDDVQPQHAKRDVSAPQNNNTSTRTNQYGLRPSVGPSSGLQSLSVSRSPSTAASPRSSRDSSPAGPPFRQNSASSLSRGMRSRKNSHEVSPQRPSPLPQHSLGTTPSAAAIKRALSGATTPQLQPTTNAESSRLPRAQRSNENRTTPSWPTSPRLKSPPPSANASSRRNSLRNSRKPDTDGATASSSAVQRPKPVEIPDSATNESEQASSSKGNARIASSVATLETVQETSTPVSPDELGKGSQSPGERRQEYFSFNSEDERPATAYHAPRSSKSSISSAAKSDEETRSNPSNPDQTDLDATPRPKLSARPSISSIASKSAADTSLRNMTVETETVSSIPQAPLGPSTDRTSSGRMDGGGTLRVKPKPSNETIRPKKERKKAAKKAPSINAASSSTRADIFEDRVKNAMDEATSDDSDETFVYESNPPEPPPRRSRHHSRTPSSTSLASMADRNHPPRSVTLMNLEPQRPIPKTRSMKFASSNSNYGTGDEDNEGPHNGTVRANHRNGFSLHHHIGTSNRRNNTGQTGPSILPDDENPVFPKQKFQQNANGRGSYAARMAAQHLRPAGSVKRSDGYSSIDMEAEAADDERTPLIGSGSIRNPRNNRMSRVSRYRYNTYTRPHPPSQTTTSRRRLLARCAGCILILTTVSLLIFGVVSFMFAMSKPLAEISIVNITNVIASEEEIMLDLVVRATNPNVVPINVVDLDVNLFAKSRFVGGQRWWRDHGFEPVPEPDPRDETPPEVEDGHVKHHHKNNNTTMTRRSGATLPNLPKTQSSSEPSDPPETDPIGQTMLLGHVTHLDNPLSFDGSFWRRSPHLSTGSLRLSKPGNRTEAGGTERWERVLKHDFEIIVRGVVRYSIPLGGRGVSSSVSGRVGVGGSGDVDDDDDDGGWW